MSVLGCLCLACRLPAWSVSAPRVGCGSGAGKAVTAPLSNDVPAHVPRYPSCGRGDFGVSQATAPASLESTASSLEFHKWGTA